MGSNDKGTGGRKKGSRQKKERSQSPKGVPKQATTTSKEKKGAKGRSKPLKDIPKQVTKASKEKKGVGTKERSKSLKDIPKQAASKEKKRTKEIGVKKTKSTPDKILKTSKSNKGLNGRASKKTLATTRTTSPSKKALTKSKSTPGKRPKPIKGILKIKSKAATTVAGKSSSKIKRTPPGTKSKRTKKAKGSKEKSKTGTKKKTKKNVLSFEEKFRKSREAKMKRKSSRKPSNGKKTDTKRSSQFHHGDHSGSIFKDRLIQDGHISDEQRHSQTEDDLRLKSVYFQVKYNEWIYFDCVQEHCRVRDLKLRIFMYTRVQPYKQKLYLVRQKLRGSKTIDQYGLISEWYDIDRPAFLILKYRDKCLEKLPKEVIELTPPLTPEELPEDRDNVSSVSDTPGAPPSSPNQEPQKKLSKNSPPQKKGKVVVKEPPNKQVEAGKIGKEFKSEDKVKDSDSGQKKLEKTERTLSKIDSADDRGSDNIRRLSKSVAKKQRGKSISLKNQNQVKEIKE